MTVSTTNNKKVYSGLTGQDTFAYDFRVDDADHMEVYFDDVLQDSGDYTVNDVGDPTGGDVVLDTPLADDTTVVLLRNVPLTQQTDYQPLDAFPAESHEQALDKLTFLVQQLQEQLDRSVTLSVSETGNSFTLLNASDNDTEVAYYDATLGGLQGNSDFTYDGEGITLISENVANRAGYFRSGVASRTVPVLEVLNDATTGTGVALLVTQDQGGPALEINQNNTLAAAGDGLKITSQNDDGSSYVMRIIKQGNGGGVFLESQSAFNKMLQVTGSVANTVTPIVGFANTAGSSHPMVDFVTNATGAEAARFYSNVANRTAALVEVTNDNATGTGNAMTVTQDQGGDAIAVIQTNAAGRGLDLFTSVTTRTANLLRVRNTGASGSTPLAFFNGNNSGTLIDLQHTGSGGGIDVGMDSSSASNFGVNVDYAGFAGVAIKAQTTGNARAFQLTANYSVQTVPVAEIIQDHASALAGSYALSVRQDAAEFAVYIDCPKFDAKGIKVRANATGHNQTLLSVERVNSTGGGTLAEIIDNTSSANVVLDITRPNLTNQGRSAIMSDGFDVGPSEAIVKTADEAVTSSTTLQDDNELSFYANQDTVYEITLLLQFSVGTTDSGLRYSLTSLTNATWVLDSLHATLSTGYGEARTSGANGAGSTLTFATSTVTAGYNVLVRGIYETGNTSGRVYVRWAQNVSRSGATTMRIGSFLKARRIGPTV